MNAFLRFLAIFALTINLFAITITGKILDITNGKPIQDAYIYIDNEHAASESDGSFIMHNLTEGEFICEIEHVSYVSRVFSMNIDDTNEELNILLTPIIDVMEPIIVTADRHSHRIEINKKTVEKTPLKLLEEIPGIEIVETDGRQQVSIRGCKTDEVLIVLDNKILPKDDSGNADLSALGCSNIKTIEIITDNIPAKYLSIAPAGIIKISTQSSSNTTSVSGNYNSLNNISSRINTGFEITNNLSINLNYKIEDFANDFEYDYRDSTHIRSNNESIRHNTGLALKYKFENTDLSFDAGYSLMDEGMSGDLDHPTPVAYRKGDMKSLGLSARHITQNGYILSFNSSVNLNFKHYYSPVPYVYAPIDAEYTTSFYFAEFNISKCLYFVCPELGGSFQHEFYEQKNNLSTDHAIGEKDRRLQSLWLEIPFEYNPITNLETRVDIGARLDAVDAKVAEDYYKASVALLYNYDHFIIGLTSGYSKAFKMPTFTDMYWLRDAFAEGNPDLANEITEKYNVKLNLTYFNDFASIYAHTDFFVRNTDSVIVWNRNFNGIYRPLNMGKEETNGREDYVNITLWKNTQITLSNTELNSIHKSNDRYLDGLNIPFVPEYVRKISFSQKYKDFELTYKGQWIGKKFILPANTKWTESYDLHNASIGYTFDIKKFSVATGIDINNICDTKYEVLTGYPMPGRNFSFSLKVNYNL